MTDQLPGNGFWGWLGRQIGHVKVAVKTDVRAPAASPALPQPPPPPDPAGAPGPAQPQVIYRDQKVEEVVLPDRPGVVLRRTVIDEAIVDPTKAGGADQG